VSLLTYYPVSMKPWLQVVQWILWRDTGNWRWGNSQTAQCISWTKAGVCECWLLLSHKVKKNERNMLLLDQFTAKNKASRLRPCPNPPPPGRDRLNWKLYLAKRCLRKTVITKAAVFVLKLLDTVKQKILLHSTSCNVHCHQMLISMASTRTTMSLALMYASTVVAWTVGPHVRKWGAVECWETWRLKEKSTSVDFDTISYIFNSRHELTTWSERNYKLKQRSCCLEVAFFWL